ncbi:PP2C family protein-serine/threonine phosphatase [Patescibacteria group bacterium]|nr:PP2C family protein-serine/threonine phosphatase [Patescibacteria group bacterium]
MIGVGLLLLIFIVILFNFVAWPLKKVVLQMKRLLTGRSYKNIYSNRIDEIGIIAQFFNKTTASIEEISGKLREQKRMSSELEIASSIQANILPSGNPKIPGLEIVAKLVPAAEVGGDSYDFIQKDNHTFFYIGDVTGHGAPAALVMMMVNTLLHTYAEIYDSTYDIIVNTNRQLKPRIKSAMFMTMLMMKWDHINEKLTYVGAGHEHILVFRAATGKLDSYVTGGVALGMVPDNSKLVKDQQIPLEKGDVVVLYTDGITEAKNDKGEMFELERLKEAVKRYAVQYGPEGIVHHIATEFSSYVGEMEQADDITLMIMQYTGK